MRSKTIIWEIVEISTLIACAALSLTITITALNKDNSVKVGDEQYIVEDKEYIHDYRIVYESNLERILECEKCGTIKAEGFKEK